MILYPLFWDGIPTTNNEHDIGSRMLAQKKNKMCAAPPTGHNIPILHTTGHRAKFKKPVSTTQTYNTQDTTHLLGIRDESIAAMGILETGATGLFITTRDAKLAGLLSLGPSKKTVAVADNTVIHASYKTRLLYNLPPSAMEVGVITTFNNSLIVVKKIRCSMHQHLSSTPRWSCNTPQERCPH